MGALYRPDLLFADGRVHERLALEVDGGRVVAIRAPQPGERTVDLPGRALLPGLVNAHSHAFQRVIRGRTEYVEAGREADDFWSWRELMYRAAESLSPDELYVASRQAFLEMALAGITRVGEFHYLHHGPDGAPYEDRLELARRVVQAATDVGIRITLLRVAYARSGFGAAPNPRQRRFIDPSFDLVLADVEALTTVFRSDDRVSVGIAPHSVRAAPRAWLSAVPKDALVHMHVAEQPAEIAACQREHGRRPVELLSDLGLLSPRFTAVHGVHLTDEETAMLGRAGANVCACPGTERNLGDGIVPADRLIAAGAHLSLGSDSQAGIDLLDEARQLESHLRLLRLKRAVLDPGGGSADGLGRRLFQIASAGGARSLGVPGEGSLAPGSAADFFTVELSHPSLVGTHAKSLLPSVVFGAQASAVRDVFVGGRPIVEGGRHQKVEESGRAFATLLGRLSS